MNLSQALEIVKDHIRIGRGMELTNGVPEALEMVVEELAVTQKALELACEYIGVDDCPACLDNPFVACSQCKDSAFEDCWKKHFLAQAKAGEK